MLDTVLVQGCGIFFGDLGHRVIGGIGSINTILTLDIWIRLEWVLHLYSK